MAAPRRQCARDPRPDRPDAALVATGPYRRSRNPIYLGYTLFTVALGLMSGNSWFFMAALVSLAATRLLAIPSEERHLEARFGFDYEHYRKRTRRWF